MKPQAVIPEAGRAGSIAGAAIAVSPRPSPRLRKAVAPSNGVISGMLGGYAQETGFSYPRDGGFGAGRDTYPGRDATIGRHDTPPRASVAATLAVALALLLGLSSLATSLIALAS